ncbi:sushi, von Willebrand factor type A, EGF and pentraxin domain-containing protein 1-like isoform X2 [Ruditapes philippinarum]|uniref:sushi, von Willebrand factor type A, EGF and pentraxin domain-containing protein 1-like isoform X2 n=1 Tax=Ruditapes philippinarum TaxID=129788 RepID=UPI00295BD7FF|nr:sushi, von Willebrand factor type A, EGF and pentraxin domain-containing protein 1-like isoform X2 [Ruditapes philippinarum]
MGIRVFIICFVNLVYLLSFNRVLGQYIPKEELRNKTTCDLKINLDITCGSDGVIVIQSFYFYYHPTCEATCCDFDSAHYKIGADSDDITTVRRLCSGRTDCSLEPLEGIRDFGVEAKPQEPSYVVIYHYCVPESRITSCSGTSLVSAGEPIYLTSNDYPRVATEDSSCTCSVEVFSCTSRVNSYIIDADMYLDQVNCEQNIDFLDGRSTSLDKIDCRSYSVNEIVTKSFATNYIKIDFNDNSDQNQEGFFFLGFGVTEETAFKLSCSFEEQTVCMDCGTPNNIHHGTISLVEDGNSGYGALANVVCDKGYESADKTVSCLDTGLWNTTECNLKDCGSPFNISNGIITLVTDGNTTYGAKANVICDEGFQVKGNCSSNEFQCGDGSCLPNSKRCDSFPDCPDELDELLCSDQTNCAEGQKLCGKSCVDSNYTCTDCGTPAGLQYGSFSLIEPGKTIYRSMAHVTCDNGFIASVDQISCLANGSWAFVSCFVDCGAPYTIKNGTINLERSGFTTLQSTANVSCDTGFDRSTDSISCLANGTWEQASCIIKDCGELASIDNGSLTLTIPEKTTYQSKANVTCSDGFDESLEFIQCKADGTWQDASCIIKDCGALPEINNGTLTAEETGQSTYLSKATVTCDTGFDSSNDSIVCQASGVWEDVSCIIKDCGALKTIKNGTLDEDSPGQTKYLSTATVSCDTGFDSSNNSISCQSNGEWQNASCIIKDCGDPGRVNNGNISLTRAGKTIYLSEASVTCDPGYTESTDVISCQADGKWQDATCKIKDCGIPNQIQNGKIEADSEQTTYLSSATVSCDTGFDSTTDSVICQTDGSWQDASCVIKDCGDVQTINNGSITLDQPGATKYLATATVACDPGFNKTIASIKCQANGKWMDAFCVIEDCGEPNQIDNGEIIADMDKTSYLYTANVSCNIGFDKSAEFISCQQNGEWQNASCTIKDCGTLKTISNGKLTEDTPGITTYQSTATVSCETGFDNSTDSISCLANGEWQDASCIIKNCGDLSEINNGSLTLTDSNKSTYLSNATVDCDPGFRESIKVISCQDNGQWQDASCIIRDCGAPGQIQNGSIVANSGQTTYLSSAAVSCNIGFDSTTDSVICQANGSWQDASCIIKNCGEVKVINNGTILLDTPGVTTYDASASVSCDPGFEASLESIKCQSNGEWQDTICTLKDCGEPNAIDNGTITVVDKTTYQSTASVTCDPGFDRSVESISCQQDRKWEYVSCDIKDCGIPNTISNGTITANETTYSSSAMVSCDAGFDKSNDAVTCQANGEWESASCIIKDCRQPRTIDNGNIQVIGKTTYLSKATVSCDIGYDLTPVSASIMCKADGEWEDTSCTIKDCGSLSTIDYGKITLDVSGNTTYLSTASVTCNVGYVESVATILCQANGQWQVASCKIKDCNTPNTINNGSIQLDVSDSTTYGSTASVSCDTGFDRSRASISCLASGEWQNATCTIRDCGDLYQIRNGSIKLDISGKSIYLSKASVTCDLGFDPSNESISCQADGTWQNATCVIKDCGAPGPIDNGNITEAVIGETTLFSKAIVSCDTGYNKTSSSVTCQPDGLWSEVFCNITDCGDTGSILNGSITLDVPGKTIYQSTASISCETGFNRSTATISCQSNGDWQEAFCIIKDCGVPNKINNGSVTEDVAGKTFYLSTAKVSCDTGFDSSTDSIMCQADGTWQEASCKIRDCGELNTTIEHGTITINEDGKTTFRSTASVTCDIGFYPTIDTIKCQSDGSWEIVNCVKTDCGTPPSIENGRIVLEKEAGTVFVSKANVECDIGFTPKPSVISCQADGLWENSSCEINDCGMPSQIANGSIKLDSSGETTYRSTATITCDTGFETSDDSISCQADGSWEEESCKIKDCGAPKLINNGEVNLDIPEKSTYLSKATVTCDHGFNTSTDTLICQANGLWQDTACIIIDCGMPSKIANGSIKLDSSGETTYRSTATITCDTGFETSDDSISCQADGSWEEASCKIKECGIPEQIHNGIILLDNPAESHYLSMATVSCNTGFKVTSASITCQANGQWQDASCMIKDCGAPNVINNGEVKLDIPGKSTYLSNATVTCDPGFNTSTDSVICQANGLWQDTACIIIECGLPETLANGTISLNDPGKSSYSSNATVTCDIGFDASTNEISCEASGKWQEAICIIKDCGNLPELENGDFVLSDENKTTYGSGAVVECLTGFVPSAASISCQSNGKWEDASCTKEVLDCGSLPNLDNGKLTLTTAGKTQKGATARVSCNNGYTKTDDIITCLNTGKWQNTSCDIVDCGSPPSILHGIVKVLDGSYRTYDSIAHVTCDKGYRTKKQFVACKETGIWEESSCEPEDDDEDTFKIIVIAGGVVLLIAVILLALITYLSRTRKNSANLHDQKSHRRHSYDHFERNGPYQTAENDAFEDDDIVDNEIINTVENGAEPYSDQQLPESGHIMIPQEIDTLERTVFSQHEPHRWHSDMSTHAEGSSNGWDFNYRF